MVLLALPVPGGWGVGVGGGGVGASPALERDVGIPCGRWLVAGGRWPVAVTGVQGPGEYWAGGESGGGGGGGGEAEGKVRAGMRVGLRWRREAGSASSVGGVVRRRRTLWPRSPGGSQKTKSRSAAPPRPPPHRAPRCQPALGGTATRWRKRRCSELATRTPTPKPIRVALCHD